MDSRAATSIRSSAPSEEDEFDEFWKGLLNHLTVPKLESLHDNYFTTEKRIGAYNLAYEYSSISREDFLNAIDDLFGKGKFSFQALCMFNEIDQDSEGKITWDQLLTFILEHSEEKLNVIELKLDRILTLEHARRQSIVKIVTIETEKSFCYVVITRYGQVGIYDSRWKILWEYTAILDEIGAKGFYSAKRRHIKWITDALYMPDAELLVISSSARCLTFYDTSRLHHTPIWFISGIRNAPQCLAYHCKDNKSTLYFGDEYGYVYKMLWLQPKISLLPRKIKDRLSLYYWRELYLQPEHVLLTMPQKFHLNRICNIAYLEKYGILITCSQTSQKSLILTDLVGCMDTYVFNISRGVNCFFYENQKQIIITGGNDCHVHIWNRFVTKQPIAILKGHKTSIVDVCANIFFELILSISQDGVIRTWHLVEHCCLQTLNLVFPSFSVLGKVVEWGIKTVFPGPLSKKIDLPPPRTGLEQEVHEEVLTEQDEISFKPSLNLHLSKSLSTESVEEITENEIENNEWCRDRLVIACCNHIALLKFNNGNLVQEDESFFSPPPLYKEMIVPKSWREILDKLKKDMAPGNITTDRSEGESLESKRKEAKEITTDESKSAEEVHDSEFNVKILEDNTLDIEEFMQKSILKPTHRYTLNQRLAKMERIKESMRPAVRQCAPYTALKLYDLAEMKFSMPLPMPTDKTHRKIADKAVRLLATCNFGSSVPTDRSTRTSVRSNKSSFSSR